MSRIEIIFAVLTCVQVCNAFLTSPRHLAQLPSKLVQRRIRTFTVSAQVNELSPPCISGLSEIADLYDAFLVDQWGVLFDARAPYPGAKAALEALRNAGKKVVLLSNSSKRRRDALHNLEVKMGLGSPGPEGLYLDVVTSGEVTHALVTSGTAGHPSIKPGSKVYVCGSGDGDADYVTELGCTVASPHEADWVLARGNAVLVGGGDSSSSGSVDAVASTSSVVKVPPGVLSDNFAEQTAFYASAESGLGVCRARGLPLLVANPDMIRPGTNTPMPGTIGALYARGKLDSGKESSDAAVTASTPGDSSSLSSRDSDDREGTNTKSKSEIGNGSTDVDGPVLGTVLYVGKPHEAVYAEAFRVLRRSQNTPLKEEEEFDVEEASRCGRLCVVGDAMATDILGGGLHAGHNCGRILVAHGIHAATLGVPEGQGVPPSPSKVAEFLAIELNASREGANVAAPTHITPGFVW